MTQPAKDEPRKGTDLSRKDTGLPRKDAGQSPKSSGMGQPRTGQSRESSGAAEAAFTVHVEAIAWVRTFLGGPASGTQEFEEAASQGDTVRDVLKAFSARYPQLDHALWDENARNEIGTHIEIIVNDTIMGGDYTLESPVSPGDQIILTGQYIGG